VSFTSFVGKQALYFSMLHASVLLDDFLKNRETLSHWRVCYHNSRCCCRLLAVPLPRGHSHAPGPLHRDPVGRAARDDPAPTGFPRCGSLNFASSSRNNAEGMCDNLTSPATHSLSYVVPFQQICILSFSLTLCH